MAKWIGHCRTAKKRGASGTRKRCTGIGVHHMGQEHASYQLARSAKNHCRGFQGSYHRVAGENCIGTVLSTRLRRVSISVHGTGFARVRGHARSHRDHAIHFRIEHDSCLFRYGMPPWPEAIPGGLGYPGRKHLSEWHRLRRCSRVNPLPQGNAECLLAMVTRQAI